MNILRHIFFWFILCFALNLYADKMPTISPVAVVVVDGTETSVTSHSDSAPLDVKFLANAENIDGWTAYYEWRFTHEEETQPYLIRYEENTSYRFTRAGLHNIVLYATFTRGDEVVTFTEEYWAYELPLKIIISESKLEFPNAFSPNDDGINDVYKAKEGFQSLVEFHAYIFNRWGQKIYEWTDPAGGWDGTFNGKPVKQGVYFVLVEAKGADGRKYKIRKDVNLLRGFNEGGTTTITDY